MFSCLGDYFFVNKPSQICKYVAKAFRGVRRTLGFGVNLHLRGGSGWNVHPNKIVLGDLRGRDIKQFLIYFWKDIGQKQGNFEEDMHVKTKVIEYQLSYDELVMETQRQRYQHSVGLENGFVTRRKVRTDKLVMPFSTKAADLKKKNDEVIVYNTILQCCLIDENVIDTLGYDEFAESFLLEKNKVEKLREIREIDRLGYADLLLLTAEKRLASVVALKESNKTDRRELNKMKELLQRKIDTDIEKQENNTGFYLFG